MSWPPWESTTAAVPPRTAARATTRPSGEPGAPTAAGPSVTVTRETPTPPGPAPAPGAGP
jgi:hypothetical protein